MEVPGVSSIVNRLGVLLTEEAKFLYRVSDQVEQIRVELKQMQCFLQGVNYGLQIPTHLVDARVNNWLAEIRKLAHETEDILETFVIQVSSKRGFQNTLKSFPLRSKIGAIKNKITDLTASLYNCDLKSIGEEGIRSLAVEKQQELRQSYHHVVEEDFVGFEEDLNMVVKHLVQVDDYTPSRVVSILGGGGSGKTTLAKKVYHHKDIRSHFEGLAWVLISWRYERRDILEEIFINLVPDWKKDVRMTYNELFEQLYKVQESKKCLVVLDDILLIEDWKSLERAFPNGNTGSKILLTTCVETLASLIDPYAIIHELRRLNDEESWDLLQKKSLLRRDGRDLRVLDTDREALGRKMVKLCAGVPLAIIVLGGLLARKHTLWEWEVVYQDVRSHERNGKLIQCGHGISEVLALSYRDLPHQLKPCFLYFGHFPADCEIDAERLSLMDS